MIGSSNTFSHNGTSHRPGAAGVDTVGRGCGTSVEALEGRTLFAVQHVDFSVLFPGGTLGGYSTGGGAISQMLGADFSQILGNPTPGGMARFVRDVTSGFSPFNPRDPFSFLFRGQFGNLFPPSSIRSPFPNFDAWLVLRGYGSRIPDFRAMQNIQAAQPSTLLVPGTPGSDLITVQDLPGPLTQVRVNNQVSYRYDHTFGDVVVTAGGGNDRVLIHPSVTKKTLISGGSGNDVLSGGSGTDWIYGEDGNDAVYGNGGNDFLHGGLHNDYLHGGAGRDTAVGGFGYDRYAGNGDWSQDLIVGNPTADVVVDYVDGYDRIFLSA